MTNKTEFFRSLYLLPLTFLLLLASCSKDDPQPDGPAPAPEKNRTVLFYMIDDHNLWDGFEMTLNQLEAGWDEQTDGNLLVYLDPSPKLTQFPTPVLLKISHDETDAIRSEVVKTYPEQDAVDHDVMRGVLEDAIALYPASSHGLIIGTHGSAWFPKNTGSLINDPDAGHDDDIAEHTPSPAGSTKSLSGGERYGTALEVDDLARLLPVKYDFIMFHACLMGNVEVAWQLREKCSLMVGCMQPLPGSGYPYDEIVPYLFTAPQPDFYHVVRSSAEWYDAMPELTLNFDVSVIRTDRLEALAAATKTIVDKLAADPQSYFAKLAAEGLYIDDDAPLRDLNEAIGLGCEVRPELEADYHAFDKALQAAVLQHVSVTVEDNPALASPDYFCGLSCYVPEWRSNFAPLNEYYKTHYGWAAASGFDKLIVNR